MQYFKEHPGIKNKNISWFWLGIICIFIFSLALRFWGLSRFNTLVFDEVHFAKFANNYLIHQQFFENHPPLGKYFIAIGIWLSQWLPFGHGETNDLAGSTLTPFSYRWMNALVGSFIPLVIAGIAYQLTERRFYALIAGFFAALDGLFLVESRYALINIYLIIFGLLGQLFLLIALDKKNNQKQVFLIIAGIFFGASFAVKWNGLGFLLGTYLLWIAAKIINYFQIRWTQTNVSIQQNKLQKLGKLDLIDVVVELGIIPLITYILVWIPHLQVNTNMNFWEWQKYLYQSQKSVGNGLDVHPYCSAWHTWLFMLRPVGYFFEKVQEPTEKLTNLDGLIPTSPSTEIYYDVHAIGNPVLWWLSTIAIILALVLVITKISVFSSPLVRNEEKITLIKSSDFWLLLFLAINYIANLLPWIGVTRCTFLYHYMGASVYALLTIAWLVTLQIRNHRFAWQLMGIITIFFIVVAFLYWLPIYLGLPLSPEAFHSRMWFKSWY